MQALGGLLAFVGLFALTGWAWALLIAGVLLLAGGVLAEAAPKPAPKAD